MMDHKILFSGEMWIIIPKLSPLPLLMWSTDGIFSSPEGGGRVVRWCCKRLVTEGKGLVHLQ